MSEPLAKVDSAVQGIAGSPPKESNAKTRRQSSAAAPGVMNVKDLEEEGIDLKIAPETQKLGWYARLFTFQVSLLILTFCRKINTSPSTIEESSYLKTLLTTPPIKKIDLHFPLGLEVTARNLRGVTIKDAMDAIYKQFKKRVCLTS